MTHAGFDPFEMEDTIQSGDLSDPYPYLGAARERASVQSEWPLPDDLGLSPPERSVFNILGYDEVLAVLRDNTTYSSEIISEAMGPLLGHTIVAMDEPEHRIHRAMVAPGFRPNLLSKWEDVLVRKVVDDLVDSFADQGRAELVRSFTFLVPVQIIAKILGLPTEDAPQFQRWSLEVISIAQNVERGLAAFAALREYFAVQVDDRRAHPRDDLITELVQVELDGERLSEEEIFAFLRLLLPAGMETTYRSLGNLIFALLTHPDQMESVTEDRTLRVAAIEEALRWEPPFIALRRRSVNPSQLGGVEIPAGADLNVFVGSANRDKQRFTDPDCFDVRRNANQHVTFGSGVHACLGMHLARLESRIALDALLDRLPGLRLDSDAEPPRIVGATFRSPVALPVCFESAT